MSKEEENAVTINVRTETGIITMGIEEYVFHVLSAEMPADFELNALKAQAVASRTYARKAKETGGKHKDGSVCTNSACCQAFRAESDPNEAVNAKYRRAIAETRGMILTYDGEPIEATYFSCSGGTTEDAMEVWGRSFPYLISQLSPERSSNQFYEEKIFSKTELEKLLDVSLPDNSENWFSNWVFTDGGGVGSLVVGNRLFKGTQLRKLLGLRSTLFSVSVEENQITFSTKGYGHRVGMSQYGADTLALQGKSWEEILQFYYPGTKIENIPQF